MPGFFKTPKAFFSKPDAPGAQPTPPSAPPETPADESPFGKTPPKQRQFQFESSIKKPTPPGARQAKHITIDQTKNTIHEPKIPENQSLDERLALVALESKLKTAKGHWESHSQPIAQSPHDNKAPPPSMSTKTRNKYKAFKALAQTDIENNKLYNDVTITPKEDQEIAKYNRGRRLESAKQYYMREKAEDAYNQTRTAVNPTTENKNPPSADTPRPKL